MSDPRRLRDETSDPFARALLASVESEEGPDPGARRRALAALGAGAVLATGAAVGSAAKAAGAASTAAAMGSAGSSGAALTPGAMLVLKWLGIAVLGGTAAVTAAHFAGGHEAAPAAALPEGARVSAPASTEGGSLGSAAVPVPSLPSVNPEDIGSATPADAAPVDPEATATKERAHRGAAGARSSSPVVSPPASSPVPRAAALQEQTEMLDSARASLAQGDSSRALSELDSLNRRYANGLLGEEAAVLRIEALFASGDRRRGEELGHRFLAEHPASAYAQRVRSRLRQSKGP